MIVQKSTQTVANDGPFTHFAADHNGTTACRGVVVPMGCFEQLGICFDDTEHH
jgi:hypothetical protein